MTRSQLEFLNLQEVHRHNVMQETLSQADVTERSRHNYATESQSRAELTEQARHNIAGESQNLMSIANDSSRVQETIRHNQVSEGQEASRINLASAQLSETIRHNRADEAISSVNASANVLKAQAQTALVPAQQVQMLANARYSETAASNAVAQLRINQALADYETQERQQRSLLLVNQQRTESYKAETEKERLKQIKLENASREMSNKVQSATIEPSIVDPWVNSIRNTLSAPAQVLNEYGKAASNINSLVDYGAPWINP